ncbi:MAG TPA: OmpA family protein [bacterium]|nr:OmpA family protein [bacterium]
MTAPTKPTASASVSADANVTPPAAPAAAPEKKDAAAQADPKRFEWRFELGFGPEIQGGRNGGLFGIDNISQWGDYKHFNLGGSLMHDIVGSTVRWRAGGFLNWDSSFGNENTGGSNLHQLTIGPRTEVDWSRVYKGGLWNVVEGPGVVGLYAGLGYGWGTTNVDGGFQLHSQSGLATAVGADVNLLRFNVGNVAIDLGPRFQTTSIYGDDFNNAGWNIGGFLAVRPSTRKLVETKETCDGAKRSIDSYVTNIAELRASNTKIKADLDQLKNELGSGSDPLTTPQIRDALFYREVRLALVKGGSDEKQVREAIKKAFFAKKEGKSDADADALILATVKDLKKETLDAAKASANEKYPEGFDFWAKIPGDPVPTELPPNVKDLECHELDQWIERLRKEEIQLNRRNEALIQKFDTAVLVDALKDLLGKNVEVLEKIHGFTLDIIQPNFILAKPTDADVKRLEEYVAKNGGKTLDPKDSELMKIAKPVFALTDFELENMKDVADKMNGLKSPSATRHDKVDPNEDKSKYEWMKKVTWRIEGHTDAQGSPENNQKLSERRAKWVELLLIGFGVDKGRLKSIGYGEDRLAVPEKGSYAQIQTAQTKNRRVIIRFEGELTSAPLHSQTTTTNVNPNKEPPEGEPKEGDKKAPKAPAPKGNPTPAPAPKAPAPTPAPKAGKDKADW